MKFGLTNADLEANGGGQNQAFGFAKMEQKKIAMFKKKIYDVSLYLKL